jgi:hypothetical protein
VIVRELIALFGIQLDRQSVAQADAAYLKVRDTVRQADVAIRDANGRLRDARGRFLGTGQAARQAAGDISAAGKAAAAASAGFGDMLRLIGFGFAVDGVRRASTALLTLASDAAENKNVINEVFDESAASIFEFASVTAKEVGRSEYTIRGFVATLGAMLRPMTGSSEAAAEMSTNLAKLAVDLSSFFNTTESDALIALRAGIAGESEPLRRYGVVLLDATLQEFALAQGIHKRVTSMNVAEKTALRYQFIMANTSDAQGDAARTINDYANSLRAAKDMIKDLATQAGEKLLPIGKRVLMWIRDSVGGLMKLAENSHVVEVALGVLAAAAVGVGIALLLPFLPAIIAAGKMLAILTAIGLAVDEVVTFFTGGKTAIGEFVDALFGVGSAQLYLDNYNDGLKQLGETVDGLVPKLSKLNPFQKNGTLDNIATFFKGVTEPKSWLPKFLTNARMRGVIVGGGPAEAPSAADELRSRVVATGRGMADGMVATKGSTARTRMTDQEARAAGAAGKAAIHQDVRANVTIHADPKDAAGIENSTRAGLGRAMQDAKEALHEEVD